MSTQEMKFFSWTLVSTALILSASAYRTEAADGCSTQKLAQIRKQFKAAVHESITSCHRPKGPHTTAQFEAKLTELKSSIRRKIGDKRAGKIQKTEEDLWVQLGEWAQDTNQEISNLFGSLFDYASQHLDQYKTCGANLYALTSNKKDWSPKESRAVQNAIKCLRNGASEAYYEKNYFKYVENYVSNAKKADDRKDRLKYERDRRQVMGFFRDIKELSYLTRCTDQRQKRDQIIAELRACKQNVAIDEKGNAQLNSSVPDCVPTETTPNLKAAHELNHTGEKLRGSHRTAPQD